MGVYNDVVVYFHGTSHCASFKCHSLPEDCYRPCLALHDPVTNLLMAASNSLTRHIKQLNLVNGFLNMAVFKWPLQSSDLNPVEHERI